MSKTPVEQIDENGQDNLKPNSSPVSDPKSNYGRLAAMVGAANVMTGHEFEKWFTQSMALIGHEADKVPGSADANRKTLNMVSGGKDPLAPMPLQKLTAKEDIAAIFTGDTLTEEAQDKIATLFEAAVSVKVGMEVARIAEAAEAEINDLAEQYEQNLSEEIDAFVTETTTNIEAYLDYVVEDWAKTNEVAIVDTLRTENAEEFMEGLKKLFTESYIDVPEERLDVVREMTETVTELEDSLQKAILENLELKNKLQESAKADVVTAVSEGLTMADAEKFATLIESVDFTSADDYKKKLTQIRESFIPKKGKVIAENSGSVEVLSEEVLPVAKPIESNDQLVRAAARMIGRTNW